jgi:hypothetical protein
LGFTERQARFLVTVMLHSGVCLQRQYSAFAGIVHGQKTRKFFDKLVRRGYASSYACRHNRGHVYHVDWKPLYRAIGETDSRFRRPMSAAVVMQNLMVLDAVVATGTDSWRTCAHDGTNYGGHIVSGTDATGRPIIVYVVTSGWPVDLHRALQGCLLHVLTEPKWTLHVVIPRQLQTARTLIEDAVRQEFANPLPQFAKDIVWYFQERRCRTRGQVAEDDAERYDESRVAFGALRYQALYTRWLKHGDAALELISSTAAAAAIESGAGRVEYHVIPFSYRHLSPVLDASAVPETGAEGGDEGGTAPRPPLTYPSRERRAPVEGPVPRAAKRIQRAVSRALADARRAERRQQRRRSLPPQESGLGTADGA